MYTMGCKRKTRQIYSGRYKKMAKIYVFLADGCEEVEAMTPVDILRRAGHTVCTVSITGKELVTGANGIRLAADALLENVDGNDGGCISAPGRNAGNPASGRVRGSDFYAESKISGRQTDRGYLRGSLRTGRSGLPAGKKSRVLSRHGREAHRSPGGRMFPRSATAILPLPRE